MREQLLGCLVILLRPAVRFCLRHGFKLQDVIAALKVSFVEEAVRDLEQRRAKVTVSRISVATGVHRQDVSRAVEAAQSDMGAVHRFTGNQLLNHYSLDTVSRVLNQWSMDARFTTKDGHPRVLSYEEQSSEFYELVRSVSTDVNPASILFELERTGHVVRTDRGLKIQRVSFSPSKDPREGFLYVERDSHDLIEAASENIFQRSEIPNLHARTDFDGIRADALPTIRAWFLSEGHRLHRAAREFLSQFDQDISPDRSYTGPRTKVSLSTFSLTEKPEEGSADTKKKLGNES